MLNYFSLTYFKRFSGILLTGIVIKIMDDFLDSELDYMRNKENIAHKLGPGILPYSLLLLILALFLNFKEAVSLFSASYIIGMLQLDNKKLPSSLTVIQENIFVFVICFIVTSFSHTFSSFVLITLLQMIDDYIDQKKDINIKNNNLILKFGYTPIILSGFLLTAIALTYFPMKLFLFSLSAMIIYQIENIIIS